MSFESVTYTNGVEFGIIDSSYVTDVAIQNGFLVSVDENYSSKIIDNEYILKSDTKYFYTEYFMFDFNKSDEFIPCDEDEENYIGEEYERGWDFLKLINLNTDIFIQIDINIFYSGKYANLKKCRNGKIIPDSQEYEDLRELFKKENAIIIHWNESDDNYYSDYSNAINMAKLKPKDGIVVRCKK